MLNIKGHGNKIELCFEDPCYEKAILELSEKKDFFENGECVIFYSGINLSYNEEMRFEKDIKKLLGSGVSLEKKHRLSKGQIDYSLDDGESILLTVNKSLRSGEVCESRGDLIVYGDVNPGALVRAQGNITIIGALRGAAHIEGSGKVYAVYMSPTQIKIGKVCSYNKKSENVGSAVALEENGEIILQSL